MSSKKYDLSDLKREKRLLRDEYETLNNKREILLKQVDIQDPLITSKKYHNSKITFSGDPILKRGTYFHPNDLVDLSAPPQTQLSKDPIIMMGANGIPVPPPPQSNNQTKNQDNLNINYGPRVMVASNVKANPFEGDDTNYRHVESPKTKEQVSVKPIIAQQPTSFGHRQMERRESVLARPTATPIMQKPEPVASSTIVQQTSTPPPAFDSRRTLERRDSISNQEFTPPPSINEQPKEKFEEIKVDKITNLTSVPPPLSDSVVVEEIIEEALPVLPIEEETKVEDEIVVKAKDKRIPIGKSTKAFLVT